MRVSGTELEYSFLSNKEHDLKDQINNFASINSVSGTQFLFNGARLYFDMGHPEYSTPECLIPEDVVAAEIAGGEILVEYLKGKFHVIKNTSGFAKAEDADSKNLGRMHSYFDFSPNPVVSFGYHENYSLFHAPFDFFGFCDNIMPFLCTRIIITGPGTFMFGEPSLSVRSHFLEQNTAEVATGKDKPFIKSENQKKYGIGRRFQIVAGEANMAEIASLLKIGLTDLALRLAEEGRITSYLKLKHSFFAPVIIKKVARDRSCHKKVMETEAGEIMSAYEWQRRFYDLASYLYPKDDDSEEEKRSIEKILKWHKYILEQIRNGDHDNLIGILDWPTKFKFGDSILKKYGLSIDDLPGCFHHPSKRDGEIIKELYSIEQKYHDLSGKFYNDLCKKGIMKRVIPREKIEYFKDFPPKNTRAYGRGVLLRFIKIHKDYSIQSINWSDARLLKNHNANQPSIINMINQNEPISKSLKEFLSEHNIFIKGV